MQRRSPLGLNMGALNTARGMGSPMMMVNSMVDNKASMGDTKGSPASGGEKENWLFECKACLASFKREKYLREHKRNCQPNIIKRTLQVNLGPKFQEMFHNGPFSFFKKLHKALGSVWQ